MTSIVSARQRVSSPLPPGRQNNGRASIPPSSMSNVVGVSSSLIRWPSYKNLRSVNEHIFGQQDVVFLSRWSFMSSSDQPSETNRVHDCKRTCTADTHRILLTSLPTLFAYAPCSLLSFVFLLILKKTSSPCADTTYL